MSHVLKDVLVKGEHTLRVSCLPPDDALPLLSYATGWDTELMLSHPGEVLTPDHVHSFTEALRRRAAGYSVAAIRGYQYFHDLRFKVNDDVLIPRPESELVVDCAVDFLKNRTQATVLDMGTGSGCLIIAITQKLLPRKNSYHAADISRKALSVAKKNARAHDACIHFFHSNLFQQIPRRKYDAIVANLPYLSAEQLREPSIRNEPIGALWGGTRGTELYRVFFEQLPEYVKPDGVVCIEIDPQQKNEAFELARLQFPDVYCTCINDLAGLPRVIQLRWADSGMTSAKNQEPLQSK